MSQCDECYEHLDELKKELRALKEKHSELLAESITSISLLVRCQQAIAKDLVTRNMESHVKVMILNKDLHQHLQDIKKGNNGLLPTVGGSES